MVNKIDEDSVLISCGLEAEWGACRLDMHSGQLSVYIPKILKDKLTFNGDKTLIAYADHNILILISPKGLPHVYEIIAKAQLTYSQLRQLEHEKAAQEKVDVIQTRG